LLKQIISLGKKGLKVIFVIAKDKIKRAYATAKKNEHISFESLDEMFPPIYLQTLRSIASTGEFFSENRNLGGNKGAMKIGFFGSDNEHVYNAVACLRENGYDAELVVEDCNNSTTRKKGTPHYVRHVCFNEQFQIKYQYRWNAVKEVQALYKEIFDKDIAPDIALALAQQMGHWSCLVAMKRYDIVQLSFDAISLGMFCPVPYVVCPTGRDLLVLPFEESAHGLSMCAGYKRAASIIVCSGDYYPYLQKIGLTQHLTKAEDNNEPYTSQWVSAYRKALNIE